MLLPRHGPGGSDGCHTDRPIYEADIIRLEYVTSVGWIVVRVIAEHRRTEIVLRLRPEFEAALTAAATGTFPPQRNLVQPRRGKE